MPEDRFPVVTVTVTRSAGSDGALLILVDTYEHLGEASRPLRILVNDDPVFADVPYEHGSDESLPEATDVTFNVYADQVAYLVD